MTCAMRAPSSPARCSTYFPPLFHLGEPAVETCSGGRRARLALVELGSGALNHLVHRAAERRDDRAQGGL